ncbi:MAG: hypothetical protein ABJK28_01920 [Algibacter sp.]
MKKFIQNSFYITLIFIIFILFTELITSLIVKRKSNFKISKNSKYVIFGHSHSQFAFNPYYINNISNLSEGGESYFYTYQKVKNVLNQNPQIEIVFVEFSNNQIDEDMDQWIWGDKYIDTNYPIFSPFMNFEDNRILLSNNFIGYIRAIPNSLNNRVSQILKKNYDYSKNLGGYEDLIRNKTDSLLANSRVNENIMIHNKLQEVSNYNIKYLSKIVDVCRDYGKKVILIRSPQHDKYIGYQNEQKYQLILNNNFQLIEFLDFSKFPLKNSEFGDLEHLNATGAKIFSKWFQDILVKGVLEKEKKQVFINSQIKDKNI